MMSWKVLSAVSLSLFVSAPAAAHFQEIIPSQDVLVDGGAVTIDMLFTHPMERGPVMEMKRPKQFGAMIGGEKTDLSSALKADGKGWTAKAELKKPAAAVFFVEPQPYWEAAEGKYIVHFSKVVVDAFASGQGWDASVGFPVEIEPLVRPTGLWAGNLFRGLVRKNGKPVPFAEIEVEFINDGSVKPPNDAFVTQVIKADANGVFAYAMPRAGWWGFAALVDGDTPMKGPDGKDAPVEQGGLIWVKATSMSGKARP